MDSNTEQLGVGAAEDSSLKGIVDAINRVQAVIHFDLDGKIIDANELFLEAMGYSLHEIVGKHHSIFVDSEYARSSEYSDFWRRLGKGEFHSGEYCRRKKSGEEIWLSASYNPILDDSGKPVSVCKFAKDITEMKTASHLKAALNAVNANVMVADTDGVIVYANKAIQSMFSQREGDLKREITGFNADSVVGGSMDRFHSNPSQITQFLANLKDPSKLSIEIGSLKFDLTVSPMTDSTGKRVGTVVEWQDRTEEFAVESEVQAVLSNIAIGDLTKKIEGDYDGFFGNLKTYINATVDKLTEVVQQIKDVSDSVASGSDEICQGNANLSQRTEEQASSLEETASSMEQMTSTVQANAENAREADSLAQGAKDKAEHGGRVVSQAVTAMTEINGSSKRIADIISVIDEIAFQTNLLALNASVEAARAGEQGRGFAVVASEVRNLAGRSATAAKEIKDLIEDSVNKVEQGSKLVDESGTTLEEIISAVQKVTSIVGEISSASVDQASGIEEVNKAITLMDDMTQQNAALVEEAAAASEAMGDQAAELRRQIGFFSIGGAAAGSYRPSAPQTIREEKPREWKKPEPVERPKASDMVAKPDAPKPTERARVTPPLKTYEPKQTVKSTSASAELDETEPGNEWEEF